MLKVAFFVGCAVNAVYGTSNVSQSYLQLGRNNDYRTKQYRLISFDSDGDLRIDLDFNVPFITLPIRRSMDAMKTSLISLNAGAIILGGVVLFGAAIVLPAILMMVNQTKLVPAANPLSSMIRSRGSEDLPFWNYLRSIDEALIENDVDLTACFQKVLCRVARNSSQNVAKGVGSSADKIIDGLASSQWLQHYTTTASKEAIKFGRENRNCSYLYRKCKL